MIDRKLLSLCLTSIVFSALGFGSAILPGFNSTSDGRNDDGTYTTGGCNNSGNGGTCAGIRVPVGFNLNFLGVTFNGAYINTNGNITLDSPLATYTPFGLTAASRQIIAPFFADVDTRNTASGVVQFGSGNYNGYSAFGVTWLNVGYYGSHVDKTDSFQLLLVNRSDTGSGNFDIIFNYDRVAWETGDASGGSGGLGGDSARVGYSNGTGAPNTSYELLGSAVNGALLDSGTNALITHSIGSDVLGRYIFQARNGSITAAPSTVPSAPTGVPEPGTLGLAAVCGLALITRYRKSRKHIG